MQAVGADWAHGRPCMEAKTGRLLAVADVPDRRPERSRRRPRTATAVRASFTAPFEPGSTFKALTAASVIDARQGRPAQPDHRALPATCRRTGRTSTTAATTATSRCTLTGVLIDSSNTGMSQFGERLSDQAALRRHARSSGSASAPRSASRARSPATCTAAPTAWDNQTKYATMFGQGLTTTAVQIASVYQTLANGGVRMPVQLVDGCTRRRRRR